MKPYSRGLRLNAKATKQKQLFVLGPLPVVLWVYDGLGFTDGSQTAAIEKSLGRPCAWRWHRGSAAALVLSMARL